MKAKELKQKYIEFFKSKDHKLIPSSSVIPENDPTVLFTTAGMHPLVPFLGGQPHPLGKRLVDVQKCIRTGDIDEVGDACHLSFFEMLGNWSLGDYFKEDAIKFSFEFLTSKDWLNIPLEKLAVSCFEGDSDCEKDQQAAEVWKSLGVSEKRIAFLPKKENWWGPAGETGPCGPDTEIFFWTGEDPTPEEFDTDDKKWVEIWNDVFMQYNKTKDGKFEPLSQKNVDTGLGVERVAAVLQGFDEVYKTELFWPIIERLQELTKKKYEDETNSMRIIADHTRAIVFILGDYRAIKPSNLDQGYILRRFIRRAIRHGKRLGIHQEFISELALKIIEMFKDEYSELEENKNFIIDEIKKEDQKFRTTLEKGLNQFEKIISGKKEINGKDAFLLFQSYGFPIEITQELASEKGVNVDIKEFEKEYETHQELSRKGAEHKFKGGLADSSEITVKLHTANHLLLEALKRVLKQDIRQRGSNITPERLRFDFNFDRKLTDEELKQIEDEVNRVIDLEIEVVREEMTVEQANEKGAKGEFGAKYPEIVSVYFIGDYSKEICMGPHVKNTKELGHFKIVKEQSSSAGIRRIRAVLE